MNEIGDRNLERQKKKRRGRMGEKGRRECMRQRGRGVETEIDREKLWENYSDFSQYLIL